MDSIEVQQMKAQAKEEKARKKVFFMYFHAAFIKFEGFLLLLHCLVAKFLHNSWGFFGVGFGFHIRFHFPFVPDGASDSSAGEADEGGRGAGERGDGAPAVSDSGRGSYG